MSEERLLEIIDNYENAIGVAYEVWDFSESGKHPKKLEYAANEDMYELIEALMEIYGIDVGREYHND